MSRRLVRVLAALAAGLLLAMGAVAPVGAELVTSDARYESADPRSITFHLRASGERLQAAVLTYRVLNPDGPVGGDVRATIPPGGATVDLSATLTTNGTASGSNVYIPVGARISYSWRLTTEAGAEVRTDEQTFVFMDGRYQWRELSDEQVTVYWYDNEADAREALTATTEAISDIEALLQVELTFPVRVVVWPRESAGELAQRSRGSTFDSQIITGGSRVAPDILHIYDGLGSFEDIARHEAAHIVTKVAGDGPFTRIPAWLDEGVAVYAQRDPGPGYRTALQFAISTDNVTRLRNMTASANRADAVNQFYGQSWATVQYLVDAYGEERLAQLFAAIKRGSTVDGALDEVYGFDQDGLYNEWRQSVGLPVIEFAPVAQATMEPRAEATRAPLAMPTSVSAGQTSGQAGGATGTGEDSSGSRASVGGDANVTMAIAIGVGALFFAMLLGFIGFRLMRAK